MIEHKYIIIHCKNILFILKMKEISIEGNIIENNLENIQLK
jgi:hypothetical protein